MTEIYPQLVSATNTIQRFEGAKGDIRDSSLKMICHDPSGENSTPFERIGIACAFGPRSLASNARMIGSIPDDKIMTGTLFFKVQL